MVGLASLGLASVRPATPSATRMTSLAHIGKIPVEEWLPFLVPLVALYIHGRRKERRRAAAATRLPGIERGLDPPTIESILAQWKEAKRENLSPAYLPLLYPPGPDGLTTGELAERTKTDAGIVRELLEQLEDLGYIELDEPDDPEGPRASLTFEGYDLLYETEATLLELAAEQQTSQAHG
jgi:DNA-binding MarR family transcriptional regulator